MFISRRKALAVLSFGIVLGSVSTLFGCVSIDRNSMQNQIEESFENVMSSLAVLNLSGHSKYSELGSDVSNFMDDKGGADIEAKLNNLLTTEKLNDLDKTFITYELARVKMHKKEYIAAKKNFDSAVSVAESLEPKQPDLLGAIYYSYSVCLKRAGDTAEAKVYKDKYEALRDAEKAADDAAKGKQDSAK